MTLKCETYCQRNLMEYSKAFFSCLKLEDCVA